MVLEPPARNRTDRETHKKKNAQALWVKRMSSAYIRVKKVRGQVPGTTTIAPTIQIIANLNADMFRISLIIFLFVASGR